MCKVKIVKGKDTPFNRKGTSVEELLLQASPLFLKSEKYVIELTDINSEVAKFITNFEVADIIKCKSISIKALKLLQKKRCYVVFEKKNERDIVKENPNFKRALNLPISEVAMIFG